ncbi:MAG: NADH-quinone oxidoreductase subunit E [Chloroflexi bacterium]|jgi:NADH-quinone oxidoreductase subunit F|nr:NADH-quinone oxidoreductase subunit E [Chloroflexota bacterium]MBT3671082.1 NADH-quinone oxidoreductase subunit E [Chloroflexota bacterium]MBT4003044.1 NADH-quinone oxidoreductase subunit E [Chloroflexota bacterium]MBT4304897.1 NADH-quinone oxidoreductase subunit E [Chloroflexota bacterium]MBT4534015.1 NADH-quinone oxidoreductase subunit E [Chloroflexota bacterium]
MSKEILFIDYLKKIGSRGRTMLLPALNKAQQDYGYISKENAEELSTHLNIPMADITGVIEFYSMLHSKPTAEKFIRVCVSPVCASKGANALIQEAVEEFNASPNASDPEGKYFLEPVACLGLCDFAPSALVGENRVGHATIEKLLTPPEEVISEVSGSNRVLTTRVGNIDPLNINEYTSKEGFDGLKAALKNSQQEVLEIVKSSDLKGRGGAGFPTGIKWEGAANAGGDEKYIICNEDESEPGTFKDRALLAGDPYSIIEGMIIAGYAVGAEKGFMYIRGEYPRAFQILEEVIKVAEENHYLGKNVLGKNFSFNIELRSGAGAYICGEETALFESIEGKRGFPRIKPPYPTTHGLFGKPTVINNVETFANVPLLFRIGEKEYKSMGTKAAPGPRLFSVSGDVVKPGIYEITHPVSLRELIYDLSGGIPKGRKLQSVLLGGAAGKFVHPDEIDLTLSVEGTQAEGHSLGSGAVMVFDDQQNIGEILSSLSHFFSHESCGKCFPCQLGTQRQAEIIDRMKIGETLPGDLERLKDVGWTMTDASLCGLGQTAGLAVLSAIEIWPNIFEEGNNG